MDKQALIDMIDYTLLDPTATKKDITEFCRETINYGFNTIFVNPYYVSYASNILHDYGVKVGVPIGFSLGGATTHTKVAETKEAIKNGAEEIDMLINLGALKSGEYDIVQHDRSEEHTSELQSRGHLVCRLLLVKKNSEGRTALLATFPYPFALLGARRD